MRMFQGSNGLNKASEATFVGMTGIKISPLQNAFYYIENMKQPWDIMKSKARQKTRGMWDMKSWQESVGVWIKVISFVRSCNSKSQKTKDGVSFGSVWSWEWRPTQFFLTVRKDWLVKPLEAKVLKLVAFLDFRWFRDSQGIYISSRWMFRSRSQSNKQRPLLGDLDVSWDQRFFLMVTWQHLRIRNQTTQIRSIEKWWIIDIQF